MMEIKETVEEFYLKRGLYDVLKFSSKQEFGAFLEFRGNFDGHCQHCKKSTTYKTVHPLNWNISEFNILIAHNPSEISGRKFITFKCSRNLEHEISFIIKILNQTVQKIGQDPSIADLAEAEHEKYKSNLSRSISGEFYKAITSAAHDFSIGAFVYLRRVLEFLIDERFKDLPKEETIKVTEAEFKLKRIDEKIKALKKNLPPLLTGNKNIYSVLSKGIHELDENECRRMFPVLKEFCTFILEEEIDRKKNEARKKHLETELNKFSQDLAGNEPKKVKDSKENKEKP